MPDGPSPIYVFTASATDAEMIARSREAIQRSCELLRSTQHLANSLGGVTTRLPGKMIPTAKPSGEVADNVFVC